MKKVDLSKYLKLSSEDQRALGMIADDDPYAKVAEALKARQAATSAPARQPAAGTYSIGYGCRKHRVSLRERTDLKPKRLPRDLLATPHTCLDCGKVMWRLHPGPRRFRRDELEE